MQNSKPDPAFIRRRVLILSLSATLFLAGCENMREWTELFEDLNKALLPIAVLKQSSEAQQERPPGEISARPARAGGASSGGAGSDVTERCRQAKESNCRGSAQAPSAEKKDILLFIPEALDSPSGVAPRAPLSSWGHRPQTLR